MFTAELILSSVIAMSPVRWWLFGRPLMRASRVTPVIIVLFACGYGPAGRAEIYRCTTADGGALFSDKACADNPMAAKEATTAQAPERNSVPPPSQTPPDRPKPAVRAAAAPVARSSEARARPASTAPPTAPRPAAPTPMQGGDGPTDLADLAYLRAMGKLCPLPVEHTQILRFLDMLANDRLDSQGIRLTAEQMKSIEARAREHAQRDAASAGQGACADADRRLVALGQTRVQFGIRSSPPKSQPVKTSEKDRAPTTGACASKSTPCLETGRGG